MCLRAQPTSARKARVKSMQPVGGTTHISLGSDRTTIIETTKEEALKSARRPELAEAARRQVVAGAPVNEGLRRQLKGSAPPTTISLGTCAC